MKLNDTVAWNKATLKRTGHQYARARGVIVALELGGKIARVDWRGTWLPHEDGGTVRTVPTANLTRVFSNGIVFGD
jgi:hypothetical protein